MSDLNSGKPISFRGWVVDKRYPNMYLIGYDISPDMIKFARFRHPHIAFTNQWNKVAPLAKRFPKSCLLLSSVIHEVYSYSSGEAIEKFWKEIFDAGFEFIAIRDTIPANIEKVKNFKKDVESVKKIVDPVLLKDYENKWGPIDKDYKNFVRFILVYRYRDNWERERLEDYLPLTHETFLNKISDKYKVIYNKNFKFKPIQQSFSKDYGINLRSDTHLRIILRKK